MTRLFSHHISLTVIPIFTASTHNTLSPAKIPPLTSIRARSIKVVRLAFVIYVKILQHALSVAPFTTKFSTQSQDYVKIALLKAV